MADGGSEVAAVAAEAIEVSPSTKLLDVESNNKDGEPHRSDEDTTEGDSDEVDVSTDEDAAEVINSDNADSDDEAEEDVELKDEDVAAAGLVLVEDPPVRKPGNAFALLMGGDSDDEDADDNVEERGEEEEVEVEEEIDEEAAAEAAEAARKEQLKAQRQAKKKREREAKAKAAAAAAEAAEKAAEEKRAAKFAAKLAAGKAPHPADHSEAANAVRKARLQEKLNEFVGNVEMESTSFPPTLNSFERRMVHEISDELGLNHASYGAVGERSIAVWKQGTTDPRPPEAEVPTLEPAAVRAQNMASKKSKNKKGKGRANKVHTKEPASQISEPQSEVAVESGPVKVLSAEAAAKKKAAAQKKKERQKAKKAAAKAAAATGEPASESETSTDQTALDPVMEAKRKEIMAKVAAAKLEALLKEQEKSDTDTAGGDAPQPGVWTRKAKLEDFLQKATGRSTSASDAEKRDADKVKRSRMQADYGQKKFIKP